jgi:hypothetical protein
MPGGLELAEPVQALRGGVGGDHRGGDLVSQREMVAASGTGSGMSG